MSGPSGETRQRNLLGTRIAGERRRQGLTLADLAVRSGLSVSTLSKVENGRMTLTYPNLALVAEGLGIDVAMLFRDEARSRPAGRRSITRERDQNPRRIPGFELRYLAEEMLEKRLVPMVMTVEARSLSEAGGLKRHDGEEVYYVLRGAAELHTDIYAPLRLEQGDCVYMDGTMGHTFVSVGQ
ncbi:MAG: helix-turn-helix domain-containing protein, partial [Alphaproteobacteria bacterium]